MKRTAYGLIYVLSASFILLMLLVALRAFDVQLPKISIEQPGASDTEIQVSQQTEVIQPTETAQPSVTPTAEPTNTVTPTPEPVATATPENKDGCNIAYFVADVTVPDKAKFNPDEKFTKTWKFKNGGSCTWTTDFKLYFYSGDQMSGPTSKQMMVVPVDPDRVIDVSVVLRAPTELGIYKGFWAFKDEQGNHFGLTRNNLPFYVEIEVVSSSAPDPTP
jgi:hypothetical protein